MSEENWKVVDARPLSAKQAGVNPENKKRIVDFVFQ
jgi:hypothetical protein